MVSPKIEHELLRELEKLSEPQQRQVLDFEKSLKVPLKEVSPDKLRQFVGAIPLEDLERMKAVIEADCERIEDDGG